MCYLWCNFEWDYSTHYKDVMLSRSWEYLPSDCRNNFIRSYVVISVSQCCDYLLDWLISTGSVSNWLPFARRRNNFIYSYVVVSVFQCCTQEEHFIYSICCRQCFSMLWLSVRLIDLYRIGIELITICMPEKQFHILICCHQCFSMLRLSVRLIDLYRISNWLISTGYRTDCCAHERINLET